MSTKTIHRSVIWKIVIISALILSSVVSTVKADTWRGTAPFCAGECLPGETQIAISDSGDGGSCWSGKKVLCRNSEPTCTPVQTRAKCIGVVQVCDNGYYSLPDVWHSCSKHACGACFFGTW